MKLQSIIGKKYWSMKRQNKINEQLEIGKIKFEVIPIYFNKTCIHSLFKLKYNSFETSSTPNTKKILPLVIKILIILIVMWLLYINISQFLVNLGIFALANNQVIPVVSPYIFQGIVPALIPHLSILLLKSSILTI